MYKLSKWGEYNFWIDIIIDLSTIALFAIATVMVFRIVYKYP